MAIGALYFRALHVMSVYVSRDILWPTGSRKSKSGTKFVLRSFALKNRSWAMAKLTALLGAIAAICATNITPAAAVGEDVFVVPRVFVQANAGSATAAKNSAQAQGRRKAMDILLRRLTVEQDWVYLPRLAAYQEAPATPSPVAGVDQYGQPIQTAARERSVIMLDNRALERMESGFEVYGEKSSANSYRAAITYRFKPQAVRTLLKDARIPYSEAQTRTALVLPVLQTPNGLYLWEGNNPWMSAWKSRPFVNELTPMTAPLGDLEDETGITARQALRLDQDKLQALASRYSVSQVIVAHAFLRQSNGMDELNVRLINGLRESGALNDASITDASVPLDPIGERLRRHEENIALPASAKVGDVLAEAWFKKPSGNFPQLAEESIEMAIAKYASGWKAKTLIDHSSETILQTSAFFTSIAQWSKIRRALVDSPLVGSVQVTSLSRRGAEMLIRNYGDPNKLVVAMEAQGLTFWSPGDQAWYIASPEVAQQLNRSRRRFGEMSLENPQEGVFPAGFEQDDTDQGGVRAAVFE